MFFCFSSNKFFTKQSVTTVKAFIALIISLFRTVSLYVFRRTQSMRKKVATPLITTLLFFRKAISHKLEWVILDKNNNNNDKSKTTTTTAKVPQSFL